MWGFGICSCCSAQLSSVPQPCRRGEHTLWADCEPSFSGFAYFEQRDRPLQNESQLLHLFPAKKQTCSVSRMKKQLVGCREKKLRGLRHSVMLRSRGGCLRLQVPFPLCVTIELREELLPPWVWAGQTHREIVNWGNQQVKRVKAGSNLSFP